MLGAGGALLSTLHLAAAEVLQEVGEALDDAAVFGAVSGGVAEEDFGAGPGPLGAQRCALIGRLAAFFIQLAVDVLCSRRGFITYHGCNTTRARPNQCLHLAASCDT